MQQLRGLMKVGARGFHNVGVDHFPANQDNCKHLDLTSPDGPWDWPKLMLVQSLEQTAQFIDVYAFDIMHAYDVQGISKLSNNIHLTPETLKDVQLTIQATTQNSI